MDHGCVYGYSLEWLEVGDGFEDATVEPSSGEGREEIFDDGYVPGEELELSLNHRSFFRDPAGVKRVGFGMATGQPALRPNLNSTLKEIPLIQ